MKDGKPESQKAGLSGYPLSGSQAVPSGWAAKRLLHDTKSCIDRFRLLEQGERFAVGVSGGADSLCLLSVLAELNRRLRREWIILPVHIDPGFPGWQAGRVQRACRKLGFDCAVRRLDLPETADRCYACARARRRALFQAAAELGTAKLALGHHLEDVNETYLLNLLMTASAAAFLPRQELFHGAGVVIRPLYYADRPLIDRYLRRAGIRAVRNRCPHESAGARRTVRLFLERLYRSDHRIRTNLFWGIHNPKPEYLPAKRPGAAPRRPKKS